MRYLLMQLLLQVLLQPEEFSEAASELVICCSKAFRSSDLAPAGEDEADGDGTPELMDVLVDTMLSLLPQSSAPMRTAIEKVFKCFCHDVTDDGLLRMLCVIKKNLKQARRQETDIENDDDDDNVIGIEEAEDSDEVEMDETATNDGQADSGTLVDIEAASAELLEASDDDFDEGMDDDTMFRMDTYLAKCIKERTNQTGGETADSQLVHFKYRVLSLLEIYLNENPGKPQVLTIFSHLAQAFINSQSTEGRERLGQRIWGILQKIIKAKDYPRGEDIQFSVLKSLLKSNFKLAARRFKSKKSASNMSKEKQSVTLNRYKMINSLAQSSIFYILKIINATNLPESKLQKVFGVFKKFLKDYFSKRSQLTYEFLKEIFKKSPWIGYHLFGYLLKKCAMAKRQFKQIEALDLVMEIIRSIVSANPDENSQDSSRKKLKRHLRKLGRQINKLFENMPEKASRRADVRKFCGKVNQILVKLKLRRRFLRHCNRL